MGREIRRVSANWKHPKDDEGRYKPLYDTICIIGGFGDKGKC